MLRKIGILILCLGTFSSVASDNSPDGQDEPLDWNGPPLKPEPRQLEGDNPKPSYNSSGDSIHQAPDGTDGGGDADSGGDPTFRPEPRQNNSVFSLERRNADDIQTITLQRQLTPNKKLSRRCQSNFAFNSPGQTARIQSDNYPRDYPNNLRTSICLSSPSGTQMNVACDDFNVENHPSCAYDYLGISLNGNPRQIRRYCGQGTLKTPNSSGNRIIVVFKSDSSNPGGSRSPFRFRCTVTVSGSPPGSEVSSTPPPSGSGGGGSGGVNCKCGQRNDGSRIIGGTDARPGSLPWRCYLRTASVAFFCGCSIISNNWILTAAHCSQAVNGQGIQVVVGDHDRSTTSEASSQQIPVATVYDHPQYDEDTMDNDISLLKLSRAIVYSDSISPVCLPFRLRSETFANRNVTASGWGRTSQGGSTSNTLKEVNLPVLTTEQCARYYPGQVTENMICTYNPGLDTCQGDSGGSIDLFDNAGSRGGRMYAIGVVSWGIGCAQRNRPGVYAKTTKYLDFIQRTTGEQFCQD